MQLKPQTKWLEITGENSYVQPTEPQHPNTTT